MNNELKHLHLTIPNDLYIEMMRFIQESRGFYRKGDTRSLIIKAIKNHIATNRTHAHYTQFTNSFGMTKRRERLSSIMQQIIEFRVQKGQPRLEKGHRISLSDLKEAISNITGCHDSQNRSLKKWMKDLVSDGYITNKGNLNPNVFLILSTGSTENELDEQKIQSEDQESKQDAQREFDKIINQVA